MPDWGGLQQKSPEDGQYCIAVPHSRPYCPQTRQCHQIKNHILSFEKTGNTAMQCQQDGQYCFSVPRRRAILLCSANKFLLQIFSPTWVVYDVCYVCLRVRRGQFRNCAAARIRNGQYWSHQCQVLGHTAARAAVPSFLPILVLPAALF